jgi:hypothetical protein
MRGGTLLCVLFPLCASFHVEMDEFLAMHERAYNSFPKNGLDMDDLKGWLAYSNLAPRSEAELATTFFRV